MNSLHINNVVEDDRARTGTLELKLRADSGYQADETHRISPEQWGRICQILNEAPPV